MAQTTHLPYSQLPVLQSLLLSVFIYTLVKIKKCELPASIADSLLSHPLLVIPLHLGNGFQIMKP